MPLDIRLCAKPDLERFLTREPKPGHMIHNEQRLALQETGEALFLTGWLDGEFVARTMLLWSSKYDLVRDLLPGAAEINGLHSYLEGKGHATELIVDAENRARAIGRTLMGLAVERENHRAWRLYEHLGYREWEHGDVIDHWEEPAVDGKPAVPHVEVCAYLMRNLVDRG